MRFAGWLAPGANVLDLACGSGRNARALAECGLQVEAVDRDARALQGLAGLPGIDTLLADLEGGPWPYADRQFDAIVVCNYLHRPLFEPLIAALATGGLLIWETFMQGNEKFGKPSNPDFLLRPNELLQRLSGSCLIAAFEQGVVVSPKQAMLQRVCAVRGDDAARSRLI